MYDLKADPREMNNVFGKPEYAEKQKELMQLLQETQNSIKTTTRRKVNELFKGDRRLMKTDKTIKFIIMDRRSFLKTQAGLSGTGSFGKPARLLRGRK